MWTKIVVLQILIIYQTWGAKLPSNFGRCHTKDKDFDNCVQVNIENAIRALDKGSPQLGLHAFEPLDIPSLVIGQGKGPVQVMQNFDNVHLHGLTGSKVLSAKVDLANAQLFVQSITPDLRLEAHYQMAGRILLLPIVGDGPCNVTLINTKLNHTIRAERVEKKGAEFWRIVSYNVTLRPEKVQFKFDNLFNGQARLGDEINKVLNDNWDEVFTDVRAGYEQSFGVIFHSLASQVFNRVALKDIFLYE